VNQPVPWQITCEDKCAAHLGAVHSEELDRSNFLSDDTLGEAKDFHARSQLAGVTESTRKECIGLALWHLWLPCCP
jgi:hypothetical protein